MIKREKAKQDNVEKEQKTQTTQMSRKQIAFFLTIIILAVLLRAIPLNAPLYGDDEVVMRIAEDKLYFGGESSAHPPLTNIILIALTSTLGFHEWVFRLPAFLTAIGTILLLFFFAREWYSTKVALWATFFLAISPWHIYAAKTNMGGDGVLGFFLLASAVVFLRYIKENNKTKLLLIGIVFAIACLVKETAILFVPIALLYMILQKMKIKEIAKKTAFIFIGGLIVGTLFVGADFFLNDLDGITKIIANTTEKGVERLGYTDPQITHHIFSFFKIAVWLSPLLLLLPVLWFLKDKNILERCRDFSVIYIAVYGALFGLYLNPVFDKSRYLLVIAPFLALLAARYIAEIELSKKQYKALIAITLLLTAAAFTLNIERNIVSYENLEYITNEIKSLSFNFDIALTSDTGSPGLVFSMKVFVLMFLLAIISAVTILIAKMQKEQSKKKEIITIATIILLAAGISYAMFVSTEFIFQVTTPDYEEAQQEVVAYALEHDLPEPIYLFKDPAIIWYLKDKYTTFYGYDNIQMGERLATFTQQQAELGGTILFVDVPFIDREGDVYAAFSTCEKVFASLENGYERGAVFVCS